MAEVSVSVLNVPKENAIKTFYDLEVAKTDYYHIDVMDGEFVINNTAKLMLEYANEIKHISNIPLDIHLMVKDYNTYIKEYIALEPCYITVHREAFENIILLKQTIDYVKSMGIKIGVSIKPNTDLEEIYEILPYINLVLVMTVEPGKGGQELIPTTINKIEKLSKYRDENNLEFYIEADGGINDKNANLLKKVGTDILVSGTAIISSQDYKKAIIDLKQ